MCMTAAPQDGTARSSTGPRMTAGSGRSSTARAFADLPRKGVPLECFYLPLHENWPMPMEGNYNEDYWADRAFPARYRDNLVKASRLFAEHAEEKRWHGPLFHFFLNGKHDFKKNGWSRGSSPWLLDEPASFQDYWALRYFGSAFHEGVRQSGSKARMLFRADISARSGSGPRSMACSITTSSAAACGYIRGWCWIARKPKARS